MMRLLDWLDENEPESFLILVLAAVVILVVVTLIHSASLPPRECSTYANSFMKDIPARCIEYWANPR